MGFLFVCFQKGGDALAEPLGRGSSRRDLAERFRQKKRRFIEGSSAELKRREESTLQSLSRIGISKDWVLAKRRRKYAFRGLTASVLVAAELTVYPGLTILMVAWATSKAKKLAQEVAAKRTKKIRES